VAVGGPSQQPPFLPTGPSGSASAQAATHNAIGKAQLARRVWEDAGNDSAALRDCLSEALGELGAARRRKGGGGGGAVRRGAGQREGAAAEQLEA
jgi:hypothetical protein